MVTTPNLGLKVWNNVTDPYDHAQLADNWAKVDQHDHSSNKGVPIPTGGIADGAITTPKLATSLTTTPTDGSVTTSKLALGAVTADTLADAAKLGLTDSTNVRRGSSIIATPETRSNVAYGTLTTPDQVTVTLPTNGLILAAYQAVWSQSSVGTTQAAIFIGANQLQACQGAGTPTVQQATQGAADVNFYPLTSFSMGLQGGSVATTGDVTTGQSVGINLVGGPCCVFAAAGTYIVSIQFKSSVTVTVKNRKLWVWTMGF